MAPSAPNSIATKEHCFFCFDVLDARLKNGDTDRIRPTFANGQDQYALFVTWNTLRSDGDTHLRGCIGNFSPMPLSEGLRQYAIISAMEDHRFSPITPREFSSLECSISLLTPFEQCSDYLDWELGTHGIHITLTTLSSSRPLTATYLPYVATDQNWSKVETIDSAIRKAGYRGVIDDNLRKGLKVRRYTSVGASGSWEEWEARSPK